MRPWTAVIGGAALVFLAWPGNHAPAAAGTDPIVYCFDPNRDQVAQMRAEACKGEIVTKAKAEEIRERRRQRIRAIMQRGKPKPMIRGTRLASTGTGFFVAKSGHLLTNNHVIDGCRAVSVELPQGKRLRGTVLDRNVPFDLALVKVDYRPESIAVFRTPLKLSMGEQADLVGYPTQGIAPILPVHTKADLLKIHGRPGDFSRFQIRGDVRGGNSGGPVLDGAGMAIGVIFAQLNSVAIFKKTGTVPDDIGIAVANPVAIEFLRRNRVRFEQSRQRPALDRPAVLAHARRFIARMGCWK